MASGAGLNRVGQRGAEKLLILQPSVTAVASPLTAYGTIGLQDSGLQMLEAIGFKNWTFQLIQVGTTALTGYTVTLYGTTDPLAYTQFNNMVNSGADWHGSTIVSPENWFQLPAPSEQGSTGSVMNPISATGQVLNASIGLVAVRAVVTAVSTPAGTGYVGGFAIP